MKYNSTNIERLARGTSTLLEEDILKAGIFYRIFYRCKGNKSLLKKLESIKSDGTPKYDSSSKFIRDIIGIRINLYFVDDLEILTNYFKEKYVESFVEETIDQNTTTEFKPTRVNLIFKIPSEFQQEFCEVVKDDRIDSTFELQLRTVFSEGWHEVEHDLRYKCPDDWNKYADLSRMLNGILAALETKEWSIIQLLERLSYNHYKEKSDSAMIRTKLRIRLDDFNLSNNLLIAINSNENFRKDFFKIDRSKVILFLLINKFRFPFTLENIIFLINHFFILNENIGRLVPDLILEDFEQRSELRPINRPST